MLNGCVAKFHYIVPYEIQTNNIRAFKNIDSEHNIFLVTEDKYIIRNLKIEFGTTISSNFLELNLFRNNKGINKTFIN